MTPACTALSLVAVFGTAYAIVRAVRRRRADRAWAAGVASRVHDEGYLQWLEEQFEGSEP